MNDANVNDRQIRTFSHNLSLWLSWIVLALFTAIFLYRGNWEFLLYAITLSLFILIVQFSDRRLHYQKSVKWLFLLWLLMHMSGGFLHFGGERLYDIMLVPLIDAPYYILRYDQAVHFFCYLMIGGLLGSMVEKITLPHASVWSKRLIIFLTALGIGAVNEIIEFAAVAAFGSTGVGDYFNNALDNVFNGLGALAALLIWPQKSGANLPPKAVA